MAEVELPCVRRDDIGLEQVGQELVISGEFSDPGRQGRALRRGRRSAPGDD